MFLHKLRIWNFRKVGTSDKSLVIKHDNPGVEIILNKGLNVLIGENDSGITAIVDSIRFVLGTSTFENQRLAIEDFHFYNDYQSNELKLSAFSEI